MNDTINQAPDSPKLNSVLVKFKDSENNYLTSVSSSVTEKAARAYFVGKRFNLGCYPFDAFYTCIDIEFTDNNKPHD